MAQEVEIPRDIDDTELDVDGKTVKVTNLRKPFWAEPLITKGDLIRYYVSVAPALLPHIADRAMVMKRYPHGWKGKWFFMKRAPKGRPEWIVTTAISHASGNVIDFPVIGDLASLIWVVNLGCIDLNPWYARLDDVHRPDYLHFDLDPGDGAGFPRVLESALALREGLVKLGMDPVVKTTGSKGVHMYVPIVRAPLQKEVWTFAKAFAVEQAEKHPEIMTAVYKRAKRPPGRVLVDYNQNRWGSTLASVYSVRPVAKASVSTPVTWDEVKKGVSIDDFRIDNVPARVKEKGDLWAPNAPAAGGRYDMKAVL